MSMRFNDSNEAKIWLQQTKGNKLERSKLDEHQIWSFRQVKYAVYNIVGGWENQELDTNEIVEILHNHEELVETIYDEIQKSVFDAGFQGWGTNETKRHGYATKNFVLGCIEYWLEKEGY